MTKTETLRDRIRAAKDHRLQPVSVPEWGLETGLYVRSLTIAKAMEFEKAAESIPKEKYAHLYLAYCLCDDDGVALYEPAEGVEELFERDYLVISRLFDAAIEANNGKAATADDAGKSSPSPS